MSDSSTLSQMENGINRTSISPSPTKESRTDFQQPPLSDKGQSENETNDLSSTSADATEKDCDDNLVDWDGPDDPTNPLNFSKRVKWLNIALNSAISSLTPLASSMFAPAVPLVMTEFNSDSTVLATFVVSIYILGFALGPMVIAPLSELYGRLWIFHTCNIVFIIFTIACAVSTNLTMLLVFRFLQGCFGVTPLAIGGGMIGDLTLPAKRGRALAIYAMGPLLGPVIGPVCGGFLAEAEGWRWLFWVIAIAVGVVTLLALCLSRESYAPTILERKTIRLRKLTGNPALRSKLDLGLAPKALFIRSIVRPTKMLFLSPICALLSIHMAIVYAYMYLLFTTFTFVFQETYFFSESLVGLVYIGVGIGSLIGVVVLSRVSDQVLALLTTRNGGVAKPEFRLPPMLAATPLIPIGFFVYGWSAEYRVHWAVPIFGTLLYGIGLISTFMCINAYLIDAFQRYAASAIAANTILRSIFGGVFPLFGLRLYEALGLGWGNSLLAFVSIALFPLLWILYAYGERIRTHPRLQIQL